MINQSILNELNTDVEEKVKRKATEYKKANRVVITKVIYENEKNFEIKARVKESKENVYDTYLRVSKDEIENVTCTCENYHKNYGTCEHILATMMEFSSNSDYTKIFQSEQKKPEQHKNELLKKEKYRAFKQILNEFYQEEKEEQAPGRRRHRGLRGRAHRLLRRAGGGGTDGLPPGGGPAGRRAVPGRVADRHGAMSPCGPGPPRAWR